MKVKFVDFEEGVMAFASKLIGTMPTTAHKFISGIVLSRFAGRMESALGALAGEDGCVDTAEVRKAVECGFRASGDKVSITVGDDSMNWLIKPVVISVTKADVMGELSSIENKYAQ